MRKEWILSAIGIVTMIQGNVSPTISGVNSVVIGISQTITLEQLVSHFLILSDDTDQLTFNDLTLLEGSTCHFDHPTIGSCVLLFQLQDSQGKLSSVFPFELSWVDDTKPELEGPHTLWMNPDLEFTDDWLESLFDYDRDRLNFKIMTQGGLESSSIVVAVYDEVDNHYYHRIDIYYDSTYPHVLGWQSESQYGINVHSSIPLLDDELELIVSLWDLEMDNSQIEWVNYKENTDQDKLYSLRSLEDQEIILTVTSTYGEVSPTNLWTSILDFLVMAYEWVVAKFLWLWGQVIDFLLSIPFYRIL